jgi:hypothetical protein
MHRWIRSDFQKDSYTAVELRIGVFAGEETPVLNQSEVLREWGDLRRFGEVGL